MTEKQERILDYVRANPGMSQREYANALGISRGAFRRAIAASKRVNDGLLGTSEPTNDDTETSASFLINSDDTAVVTTRSCDIKTLEDALRYAKVDTEVWEVDHYIVNSWETTMKHNPVTVGEVFEGEWNSETTHQVNTFTNFQVKVWLRRRVCKPIADATALIIESMKAYAPKYPTIVHALPKSDDNVMLEISPFDPHLGMLAWKPETGQDWDIHIAVNVLTKAVAELLQDASSFPVKRIVIPIGQDFYHLNSGEALTPKGKIPLNVDGRFPKIYLSGFECMRGIVDMCLNVAPVELIYVPGNHDPATSFSLCHALSAQYSNCSSVRVDMSPRARKVVQHGKVLLGFTHGQSERGRDLPSLFMSEFRELYGQCEWLEIHKGHLHNMKETRVVTGDTYDGKTRVRTLPSLAGLEAYAYERGYSTNQCAEAYVWSASKCYVGHFSAGANYDK